MSSEIIESYLMIFLVSLVVFCTAVIIVLEFNWNIKGLLNKLKLERSTPLQKEIKAERKEIARLEKLKIDIEKRDQLRERRKILFAETHEEDVHEEEHSTFKGIDPLSHLKYIQQNGFIPDDIRYKAMKKQSEHFEEIIREALKDVDYSKLEVTDIDTSKISIGHINQGGK